MGRIEDKIEEINNYIEELEEIKPKKLDDYKEDIKEKAACERYFEKIVEAATDLAFLVIKLRKLETPEDDKDAFNILTKNKIIDEKLCSKLMDAKGMKNLISHQYGKIDDELVFEAITEELSKDMKEFIKAVIK